MAKIISPCQLRLRFARALSEMYQKEVPQYATLLKLVSKINDENNSEFSLPDFPRHGAVRLASLDELRTASRFFEVLGMKSVGHYDLSAAGLPIHATAFRPVTQQSLETAPFRIFASVLRPELLAESLRPLAVRLLKQRTPVFSQKTVDLLDRAEARGGLLASEADDFITGGCETLAWRNQVSITKQDYEALKADTMGNGDLLIDIMAFRNPHLNHLTPATVNIDAVHQAMPGVELAPKDSVEGPPERKCNILLRQTSFLAIDEGIVFDGMQNRGERGSHCARFGEIEQRGAALTPAGRSKYDKVVAEVKRANVTGEQKAEDYAARFDEVFPDDWAKLREQGLIWAIFDLTEKGRNYIASRGVSTTAGPESIQQAVDAGLVSWQPILYEDFLPLSAAGIFQSNLHHDSRVKRDFKVAEAAADSKRLLREVLGEDGLMDEMQLYKLQQEESIKEVSIALGIPL